MSYQSFDLYKEIIKDTDHDYHKKQVKDRLEPYLKYLQLVTKHYRENPIVFNYIYDQPQGIKPKRKIRQDEPVWIQLGEMSDEDRRYILDGDHVKHVHEDVDKDQDDEVKISVIQRDVAGRLQLARRPRTKKLRVYRIIYTIMTQIKAVKSLLHRPKPENSPLLKLFYDRDHVALEDMEEQHIDKWFVLDGRDGSDRQKEFVEKALATPDFGFLEGPPGSGKTTVLCELVHQLVHQGKRVLFCASTHIAVDNLLEKITNEYTRKPTDSNIIPLRVGVSEKISDLVRGYTYDTCIKTMQEKISNHLEDVSDKSEAQKALYEQLRSDDTIGNIARDCANLVCGTTMGILQHPDIKNGNAGMFDVMIIDEASKTTFQEFLVPAMHAKRWIIVGDTKQLAPHTSSEEFGLHVNACIGREEGQACLDAFLAASQDQRIIATVESQSAKNAYSRQCDKHGVALHDADDKPPERAWKGIVVGTADSISKADDGFFQSVNPKRDIIRGYDEIRAHLNRQKRRIPRVIHPMKNGLDKDLTWGAQMAWRIISLSGHESGSEHYASQAIEKLMPADDKDTRLRLEDVKKIALPSILHLLQHGYGTGENTIMTEGIPEQDFAKRHVLLQQQYRMHPEIAKFPRTYVYKGRALETPKAVGFEREWSYREYEKRSVWIDVKDASQNSSEAEAECIMNELEKFYGFAIKTKPGRGLPWEVAILTFYTKQQQTILSHIKKIARAKNGYEFALMDDRKEIVTVQCRTLDSFQGYEADVVFLSIANNHPTLFLENPNRINVAITRARYQNVIVGDKKAMSSSRSLMGRFAMNTRVHRGCKS